MSQEVKWKRLIGFTFSAIIDILRVFVNSNKFLIGSLWERVIFEQERLPGMYASSLPAA